MRVLLFMLVVGTTQACRPTPSGSALGTEPSATPTLSAPAPSGRAPTGMGIAGPHYGFHVDGDARVFPGARAASFPALVCAGHTLTSTRNDGTTRTSPVMGRPAVDPDHAKANDPTHAFVYCATPDAVHVFGISEFIYYPAFPRNTGVYMWLEPVPELAPRCAATRDRLISVPLRDVYPPVDGGPTLDDLSKLPCRSLPGPKSVASAVVFREDVGQAREAVSLELR